MGPGALRALSGDLLGHLQGVQLPPAAPPRQGGYMERCVLGRVVRRPHVCTRIAQPRHHHARARGPARTQCTCRLHRRRAGVVGTAAGRKVASLHAGSLHLHSHDRVRLRVPDAPRLPTQPTAWRRPGHGDLVGPDHQRARHGARHPRDTLGREREGVARAARRLLGSPARADQSLGPFGRCSAYRSARTTRSCRSTAALPSTESCRCRI